jgi:hypothetical protein
MSAATAAFPESRWARAATPERVRAGSRMIVVARVRITDAGKRAVSN